MQMGVQVKEEANRKMKPVFCSLESFGDHSLHEAPLGCEIKPKKSENVSNKAPSLRKGIMSIRREKNTDRFCLKFSNLRLKSKIQE